MSDSSNPQGVGTHPLTFEIGVGVDTHELLAAQRKTAAYASDMEAATVLVYQLLRSVQARQADACWLDMLNMAAMLLANDEGHLDPTP